MNKEAILEGLLFVVGDEGITLDNIVDVMAITKKEAQELLKKLREEYNQRPSSSLILPEFLLLSLLL